MNLKKTLLFIGLALMLALALPLRAQNGCVDSPEDPTIILALLAGAGLFATSLWRVRGHRR
jgi:XrtJ-associated TM-motif-TM protein